jgi:hypothetical protein
MTSPLLERKPTLAVVIQFPVRDISCFNCEHWRGTENGAVSWCDMFEQTIDSEAYEAEDCGGYERCEEGSQPIIEDPVTEEEE